MLTDSSLRTSITRMSQEGDQRPSCSPKMRRDGSRRTWDDYGPVPMSALMLWTAPPPARECHRGVEELLNVIADANDKRVPEIARACLLAFRALLRRLKEQILEFDRMIRAWHQSSERSQQLDDCPGVGPALATALIATVADPKSFRSGRNFSAWIGLVPKQHSSGRQIQAQ